jgi:hypothetical protein
VDQTGGVDLTAEQMIGVLRSIVHILVSDDLSAVFAKNLADPTYLYYGNVQMVSILSILV